MEAAYAREAIARGSKSFAAASRLLPATVRDDVARLYAWCRHCDDVIDGQVLGHGERQVENPGQKLVALREATDAALDGTESGDPIFDGFGSVARAHGISKPLAHDLLDGFAKDVDEARYPSLHALCEYCYGVAGAVGVMMALVIGVRADDGDTLDRACDLGLAFQMTNIARDVVADAKVGRVYLPQDWLIEEGVSPEAEMVAAPENAGAVHTVAERLVDAADAYYRSAEVGVARLPFRVAWAIASAGRVYREIGVKRKEAGPEGLAVRARTRGREKTRIIALAAASAARGERNGLAYDRAGLWNRPPRP